MALYLGSNKKSKVILSGYEKGKQAEYDRFWDSYQTNGNRGNYADAFAGSGWNNETFKPKYNIKPTNCYRLFAESKISGDLVAILNDLGVSLDTSKSTDMFYTFAISEFTHLGVISFESVTALNNTFRSSKVQTIDELIFKNDGSNTFNTPFTSCNNLTDIRKISGVIGNNISFANSNKLTHDSLMNILNALGTVASTRTLTLHAESKAILTNEEKAIATEKGWTIA